MSTNIIFANSVGKYDVCWRSFANWVGKLYFGTLFMKVYVHILRKCHVHFCKKMIVCMPICDTCACTLLREMLKTHFASSVSWNTVCEMRVCPCCWQTIVMTTVIANRVDMMPCWVLLLSSSVTKWSFCPFVENGVSIGWPMVDLVLSCLPHLNWFCMPRHCRFGTF